jgi:hypothetical protein
MVIGLDRGFKTMPSSPSTASVGCRPEQTGPAAGRLKEQAVLASIFFSLLF